MQIQKSGQHIRPEVLAQWKKIPNLSFPEKYRRFKILLLRGRCIRFAFLSRRTPQVFLSLQAMAMELPIITTEVPGCRDTVAF
ncbi:MAG: hypothetical protein R2879_14610 [Saprospiraceae bacterium]